MSSHLDGCLLNIPSLPKHGGGADISDECIESKFDVIVLTAIGTRNIYILDSENWKSEGSIIH